MNGAQQEIYKMLTEILGGINCVKTSVLTPYYHKIGKTTNLNRVISLIGILKKFFLSFSSYENFQID